MADSLAYVWWWPRRVVGGSFFFNFGLRLSSHVTAVRGHSTAGPL